MSERAKQQVRAVGTWVKGSSRGAGGTRKRRAHNTWGPRHPRHVRRIQAPYPPKLRHADPRPFSPRPRYWSIFPISSVFPLLLFPSSVTIFFPFAALNGANWVREKERGKRIVAAVVDQSLARSLAMGRAPCCEKDSVKRGPWTPEEDAKLLACIAQHGTGSWRTLPKKAGS